MALEEISLLMSNIMRGLQQMIAGNMELYYRESSESLYSDFKKDMSLLLLTELKVPLKCSLQSKTVLKKSQYETREDEKEYDQDVCFESVLELQTKTLV